jgi:hypothetical protein
MSAVFISYRRDDTSGEARALFDFLSNHLGKKSVFMDVDSIALGRDFRTVLQETTSSCDLMLVLIGRSWVGVRDENGKTRIENPTDYVRLEIGSALKRNIPITPVLVQGAHIPGPQQLPAEIRDLAYRNAFELSHNRWESDVREMTRRLLGPDALAARRYKINRRVMWVFLPSLFIAALLIALLLPAPPATTTKPIEILDCTADGPVCDRMFKINADARGHASAKFSVGRGHCSPMRLRFFVDGKEVKDAETRFGYYGPNTVVVEPVTVPDIDLGLVNKNSVIALQAETLTGGCASNPPVLGSWGGNLTLTITRGSLIALLWS